MRACVLTATGGLAHLAVTEVPDPRPPGPGQVRVAVQAAALNHLDLFVAQGLPGVEYGFPHIMGADGAGLVDAVGAGVTRAVPGERVLINPGVADYSCAACRAGEHPLCPNFRLLGEHLPGTLAEFVVVPEQNVERLPPLDPALTWAEAAAFSLVTLTAWRMVVTRARVQAGETVLVWGIGGGVSLAAMRIAKLVGAKTIVTSSSDAKLHAARALGADVTVNHRTQNVAQEVRALTGKRGVEVVVENVGEATWDTCLRGLGLGEHNAEANQGPFALGRVCRAHASAWDTRAGRRSNRVIRFRFARWSGAVARAPGHRNHTLAALRQRIVNVHTPLPTRHIPRL